MSGFASLIDWSAWTGRWPFMPLRYGQPEALEEKLRKLGVSQAFVAPLEAVFEQDPTRANRALIDAVRGDFFSPVPVIDLSYANWEENLRLAEDDGRVRMVKLLPNYHQYELNDRTLAPLVERTARRRIIVSIQLRIEDRRGQHPLVKVDDVDVVRAVSAMAFFPQQRFVLSNAYAGELTEALHSLDNVWADISSVEYADTLQTLEERYPDGNLLFATHSPYYVPEAALYKLKDTDADAGYVRNVAHRNAERLLNW